MDATNSMCSIYYDIEDMEHFLLVCHLYGVQRHALLGTVNAILLSDETMLIALLYYQRILICNLIKLL